MVNNIFAFKKKFFKFDNVIMSKVFIMSYLISFTWEEKTLLTGIVTAIIDFVPLYKKKKKPFMVFLF